MPEEKKTCFVVMGFGKKVDFQTGRKLNLDASYHNMIKPTVEEAGLECVRADEIVHSGTIDVPMYEQLLKADVVIADLSTYNPHAFYELGVRHALRPYTTIVIAEDKLTYPFDVSHIVIRRYRHLGDDIGVGDARKFSAELKQALKVILENRANDSPVYEFLNGLTPPALAEMVAAQAAQTPQTAAPSAGDVTLGMLMQQAAQAQKALEEARALLETLNPATSNDTETLGLWGAVHKRLWDETEDPAHLDEAVRGYERGFYLCNDYYNGINLAFLLNVRSANAQSRAEAVADFVQAQRVRREVLSICESLLKNESLPEADKYWVLATEAEAYLGVGDEANAQRKLEEASAPASTAQWMKESTREQMNKLRSLLADSPLKYVREGGE